MPGAVIAVGVLIPVTRLDHVLAAGSQAVTGTAPGLILTGGIAALVYAYLVRFFAVSLQAVDAGLAKITPTMDERRALAGPAGRARRSRGCMRRCCGAARCRRRLLVFVDVMKELPATFVMRPFNFDTLAVQAYNLASDERLAEACNGSAHHRRGGPAAVDRARRAMILRRRHRARRRELNSALLVADAIEDFLRQRLVLAERADVQRVHLERAQRGQRRVVQRRALDHRPLVVAFGEISLRRVAGEIFEILALQRRGAARS